MSSYYKDLTTVTFPDPVGPSKTSRYAATEVITIAWNNPATRIAYSRTDGSIRSWRLTSCELSSNKPVIIEKCHDRQVESISWKPTSETILATVGNDEKVKLWNTQRGVLLREIDVGVSGNIVVQYSGDAKYIVSVSKKNVINIIDDSTFEIVETITLDTDVYSVTWNNTSSFLFFGLADGTISMQSFKENKLKHIHTLKGHRSAIKSLVFDARGGRLAAGSNEGTVSVWSLETFAVTHVFTDVDEPIAQVDITRDAGHLAISYEDGEPAKIYELQNGKEVHSLPKCVAGSQTYPNIKFCPIKTTYVYTTRTGDVMLTVKGSNTSNKRDRERDRG